MKTQELMIYVHVWNKYLPIIKILMKKSSAGSQTLNLNRVDFERAGSGRKAGYKFTIELVGGRVANIISGSPLASDLATAMLQEPAIRTLLAGNDFDVTLNTKFQLTISNRNPAPKTDTQSGDQETKEQKEISEKEEHPEVEEHHPQTENLN